MGRPKLMLQQRETWWGSTEAYANSSVYWNTSYWRSRSLAPALSTPFVFRTDDVKALIQSVEEREGSAFEKAYRSLVLKRSVFEFAFFATFIAATGRMSRYAPTEYNAASWYYYTIWSSDSAAREALETFGRTAFPMSVAVHRRANISSLLLPLRSMLTRMSGDDAFAQSVLAAATQSRGAAPTRVPVDE
eukprot:2720977-Prymnesium_polylepis.3